jgi:hypothetical protein
MRSCAWQPRAAFTGLASGHLAADGELSAALRGQGGDGAVATTTVHSMCGLTVGATRGGASGVPQAAPQQRRHRIEDTVDIVVIDEMSMVSDTMLVDIMKGVGQASAVKVHQAGLQDDVAVILLGAQRRSPHRAALCMPGMKPPAVLLPPAPCPLPPPRHAALQVISSSWTLWGALPCPRLH